MRSLRMKAEGSMIGGRVLRGPARLGLGLGRLGLGLGLGLGVLIVRLLLLLLLLLVGLLLILLGRIIRRRWVLAILVGGGRHGCGRLGRRLFYLLWLLGLNGSRRRPLRLRLGSQGDKSSGETQAIDR